MFGFLKKGLKKTVEAIQSTTPVKREKIGRDELEDLLLEADVSYDLVEKIVESLPETVKRIQLYNTLISLFMYSAEKIEPHGEKPFVELIVGVNGAGKTTTIAKLAQRYKSEGKTVLLGAADTFRAAAIEQLKTWAEKIDVPIVYTKQGHDPSAVAYDAINSAKAKQIDHVIIDTAGRLHTQTNLAEELKKIVRVCGKAMEGAPHRKILILDGTQGNSAINQAKAFKEMIDIDGIIITKLDGTAKGGALFSIAEELKLPIYYVGVGEKAEDLIPFDPKEFVNTILDAIFIEEEENAVPSSGKTHHVDLHSLTEAQRARLEALLDKDGYNLLSKHFVSERSSGETYRLGINENSDRIEVLRPDGTVLKAYKAEDLESNG
ncbi:signal recognition particle receptor FtsY [Hydrogenimonas cancrithermarum]|uniref:Signal recognition particle receptor FtsY n=1 Tax=Hydrogenimonas cancrithermarum TaxID=2993563 RepID=A0ABN6WSK3_9BACT|nr:signal recognition particle receptor FtsY [Hydrogenimonas cancrithermarum]